MKKTYINPSIEVIKIQSQQMLAQSAGFGEGQKGGGVAVAHEDDFDWDD